MFIYDSLHRNCTPVFPTVAISDMRTRGGEKVLGHPVLEFPPLYYRCTLHVFTCIYGAKSTCVRLVAPPQTLQREAPPTRVDKV